ncbi:hypothetical protein FKM82_016689 [Ascaphus truei]
MMKLKCSQTRTYDEDGFKKRAACLCFRSAAEDEVLLVSSSRYQDRWIVPGGGLEPEEEPSTAAAREVCEEAGVKGTLGRLLGVFENSDRKHRTFVYVLIVTEVLEDWEDSLSIGTYGVGGRGGGGRVCIVVIAPDDTSQGLEGRVSLTGTGEEVVWG